LLFHLMLKSPARVAGEGSLLSKAKGKKESGCALKQESRNEGSHKLKKKSLQPGKSGGF